MTSVATTRKRDPRLRVVIIGGGYTGVWTYRALTRWLGRRVDITVISDYDFHSFHGYVGDALAGHVNTEHLKSPLAEVAARATRILGVATHVDTRHQTVTVSTGDGVREVPYDHVVIATGATEKIEAVPGLDAHGWRMRTPGVPDQLVAHLAKLVTDDTVPHTEQVLDTTTHTVAVIGAGFTGAEMAAALAHRLGPRGHVVLIYSTALPISVWAGKQHLQRHIARSLATAGVELRPATRVAAVTEQGVELAHGEHLPAKIVIAALGNRPVYPSGLEQHAQLGSGLLQVDPYLRVAPGVWAAGDAAAVHNRRGVPVAKDALWALAAGTRIGRNIVREHRGRKPKRFGFIGLGAAATFAPWVTAADLYGIPLPNHLAYATRQVLWLWFMPSRRNALRILCDSTRARLRGIRQVS